MSPMLCPDPVRTARTLARLGHYGQLDKAGQPYILHPVAVAGAVAHLGEIYEVVGLLHDVVEDTTIKLRTIRSVFGDEVADAVDAVSRRDGETYTDFVERAAQNPIGRVVKQADIRHNLSRPASLTESHRQRYEAALARLAEDQ